MSFKLADLSYDYNALEPSIDARTMEIHHSKHHAGYTANLNKAVEGTSLEGKTVEEILSGVSSESAAVRNNGGGYYNHSLYWSVMGPSAGGEPTGELLAAINSANDNAPA
jgi:Fe-Mn family superoxide dismutase